MPSNIPWDQLKAETIRSLCADLGAKRFNSRAVGLEFLQNVENDGVEAALAVEKEKEVTAPKRKAERPAKETQVEPERRSKRARKSVGGATPVKSRRQSRAEERTMKKFDGVELPTKSQPSRRSSRAARSSSAQADDEETEGVPDKGSKDVAEVSSHLANGANSEGTSPITSGSDADKENRQVEPAEGGADADAEGEDEGAEVPLTSGTA